MLGLHVRVRVYTDVSIITDSPKMAKLRRFIQCDVFSTYPTKGNALAVVLDGEGLNEEDMREFAAWTNLAETTFLFAPDSQEADYKVRIFTPQREMPFAGHPTLGSCASWLHSGGTPKQAGVVRQECGVGIVEIDISADPPAFIAPPTAISIMPNEKFNELTTKLGIKPEQVIQCAVLNNGPEWHAFELQNAAQVLAVDSSRVCWPSEKAIGLIGRHESGGECDFEVRMLAPSSGMSEDPITGSLNSALAHWRLQNNELDQPLLVAQGTTINRFGRVHIVPSKTVAGQVSIGGHTNILVEGTLHL